MRRCPVGPSERRQHHHRSPAPEWRRAPSVTPAKNRRYAPRVRMSRHAGNAIGEWPCAECVLDVGRDDVPGVGRGCRGLDRIRGIRDVEHDDSACARNASFDSSGENTMPASCQPRNTVRVESARHVRRDPSFSTRAFAHASRCGTRTRHPGRAAHRPPEQPADAVKTCSRGEFPVAIRRSSLEKQRSRDRQRFSPRSSRAAGANSFWRAGSGRPSF